MEELFVPFASGGEVAFEDGVGEGFGVGGDDVCNDRDDALASDGGDGEGEGVVAGEDGEVAGGGDFGDLVEGAGGFLDADDVFDFGGASDGFGEHVYRAAAGDIVEDHGEVDGFGDGAEVLVEAFLGGFVVVGEDLKRGVGADFLGGAGEVDGFGGAVCAGAGDDGDAACGFLDDDADDLDVFLGAQGGGFAGGAGGDDAVGAAFDLEVNELAEGFVVDFSFGEGGDEGYEASSEHD